MATLTDTDYEFLLEVRTGLRRFLAWSEERAHAAGITSAQHQLLLAVRGHPGGEAPTIGDLAEHLLSRHHSVVGLIDRSEAADLVRRAPDPDNHRLVRITLTRHGTAALDHLAATHLEELARLAPNVRQLWEGLAAS